MRLLAIYVYVSLTYYSDQCINNSRFALKVEYEMHIREMLNLYGTKNEFNRELIVGCGTAFYGKLSSNNSFQYY